MKCKLCKREDVWANKLCTECNLAIMKEETRIAEDLLKREGLWNSQNS